MRTARWTREGRLTSRWRSLFLGKIEHHAFVGNTRMMRRLNEQSCAPHNALRAGISRALQVRARATVLPGLAAERWVAIRVASSSSLKTRVAMVGAMWRERDRGSRRNRDDLLRWGLAELGRRMCHRSNDSRAAAPTRSCACVVVLQYWYPDSIPKEPDSVTWAAHIIVQQSPIDIDAGPGIALNLRSKGPATASPPVSSPCGVSAYGTLSFTDARVLDFADGADHRPLG